LNASGNSFSHILKERGNDPSSFLFYFFFYFNFFFYRYRYFETLYNVDYRLLLLSILTLTNSSETAAASSFTSTIAILWQKRTHRISSVTALWSQETPESNSEGWTRRLTRVASCSTSGSIPPSWRSPLMQGMMKRPPTRHLLRVMVRWHTTADR